VLSRPGPGRAGVCGRASGPPEAQARAEERHERVCRLFDRAAPGYDRVERLFAIGTGSWYRRHALRRAGLGPGMRVADVGVGTGLVAREAVRLVGDSALVTGVDPSLGMLACARVPPGVRLLGGRADAVPLGDASVDFLSIGYALRHVGDLSAAFAEFHRVLAPGGRLCVLEITMPEGRLARALLRAYIRGLVPAVARLVAGRAAAAELWRYYWDTLEAAPPPRQVLAALEAAGFADVRRHVEWPRLSIFAEYQATKPASDAATGTAAGGLEVAC
jgi:demethylmenaquinone methyltransferase/2-methoxy-6-polyprenyl-1,4-benzoquinol methylase